MSKRFALGVVGVVFMLSGLIWELFFFAQRFDVGVFVLFVLSSLMWVWLCVCAQCLDLGVVFFCCDQRFDLNVVFCVPSGLIWVCVCAQWENWGEIACAQIS